MFQVQGSTELTSQPSITRSSSFILFFIDINAATEKSKLEPTYKPTNTCHQTKKLILIKKCVYIKWETFKVDTLWRKKIVSVSSSNQKEDETNKNKNNNNPFHMFHETVKKWMKGRRGLKKSETFLLGSSLLSFQLLCFCFWVKSSQPLLEFPVPPREKWYTWEHN